MKVRFALLVKPADEGSFRAYCQRRKLSLPKKTLLQQYCILHSKYFSRIVERGQHIDYHSNELVPYQQIHVDGFPKTGSFGRVDKAYAPSQPHTVLARKEIFANYDKSELDKRIQKEVETLKKLDHPHLLRLWGTYTHRRTFFILLQPFANQSLKDILYQKDMVVPGNLLLNWILDLFSALTYLHDQDIIHRDLKPENILVEGDLVYIGDFGLSKISETATDETATVSGTELYKAPEQQSGGHYGRKADVFSMACVVVDLLALGNNISKPHFNQFLAQHGPKTCHRSNHMCFRHNLGVVRFVLSNIEHNNGLGKLCDTVQYDLLQEEPRYRPSALDALKSLQRSLGLRKGFKKLPCCHLDGVTKYEDASVKSLTKKLDALSIKGGVAEGRTESMEEGFQKLLSERGASKTVFSC